MNRGITVGIAALAVASVASATFTGFEVTSTNLTASGVGTAGQQIRVYTVFARFDGPTDRHRASEQRCHRRHPASLHLRPSRRLRREEDYESPSDELKLDCRRRHQRRRRNLDAVERVETALTSDSSYGAILTVTTGGLSKEKHRASSQPSRID